MWFKVRVYDPPSHVTHWSCDHVILKKALSLLSLGQWPPILSKCHLSWVEHNHRVTWTIYHVITLYSQKGASPVSQRQWQPDLVGLWDRVKGHHLFFQVTCRSSDHVLFEKHHVSTNSRPQNSAGDMEKWKNPQIKSLFCYSKDINIWFTSIYATLKISRLCR